MKAIKIIFGLSLLFALSTCTKFGKNVTVKGRVLNPLTGEGIPDVDVVLIRNTFGQLPGGIKIIKSVTTDANGNFELSKFTLSQPVIRVDTRGLYYNIGWWNGDSYSTFQKYPVKIGKTMKMEYHAVPYGTMQIYYKNSACFDSNDQLKLYFDGGKYDNYMLNPGLFTTLDGCIDVLSSVIKGTMGEKYFHWEVTKNGITNTYYDTIFINENQNTILNVVY